MSDDEIMKYFAAHLRFSESDGNFYHTAPSAKCVKSGSVAGNISAKGYRRLKFSGRYLAAHRLVWRLSYGSWPSGAIDHINGDKADNRPQNLREATAAQNSRNRSAGRNNVTGVPGVVWNKKASRWQVQVKLNNSQNYGGLYADFTDAVKARNELAVRLQGEFAKIFTGEVSP